MILLDQQRTAQDVCFPRGAPIWYRQPFAGGYGHPGVIVPGVFERYCTIRVEIVITDATARPHRLHVSPLNVYERALDAGIPNTAARERAGGP